MPEEFEVVGLKNKAIDACWTSAVEETQSYNWVLVSKKGSSRNGHENDFCKKLEIVKLQELEVVGLKIV